MATKETATEEISKTVSEYLLSKGCTETGDVLMGSIVARQLVKILEKKFEVEFTEDETDPLRTTGQITEAVLEKVMKKYPEELNDVQRRLLEVVYGVYLTKPNNLSMDSRVRDTDCPVVTFMTTVQREFNIKFRDDAFVWGTIRDLYNIIITEQNRPLNSTDLPQQRIFIIDSSDMEQPLP